MAELRTLARPYAKAAFQSANETGAVQAWAEQLNQLGAIALNDKVSKLLTSPTADGDSQIETLAKLLGDSFDSGVSNFLKVLAENKRLPLLPSIAELFAEFKANQERSLDVSISTAYVLDEKTTTELSRALQERLNREIRVDTQIDKSLLGGVFVRAGDIVIDGSIKGRLTKLAEAMSV